MKFKHTEDLSKSFFLAQISHDLKQPMQALSIYVCSLLAENLTPEQYQIAKRIENSTNNLRNMLNNLLDISQIDARGLKYTPKKLDIKQLLTPIAQDYKAIANCQHLIWTVYFVYLIFPSARLNTCAAVCIPARKVVA